jgi:hypothetical protein
VLEGRSREGDALAPRSPYAAAKAAGELLVHSYVVTHGLDAVVTRGSNTVRPLPPPEKLIPLFVTNAIDDLPLPLYGDGLQQRDWLFVTDHAGAIDHVLRNGAPGETYNVRGSAELTNREVVATLLERLGKPWSLVRSVPDRPGHDRRYALDGAKLAALGWRNRTTVRGRARRDRRLVRRERGVVARGRSGDWDAYYERQYGARLAASPRPDRVRVAGHRRGRPARPGPRGRPRGVAFHGSVSGRWPGPARSSTSTDRPPSPSCSIATARRSSSMPLPGRTSTAAPATRSWRSPGTARRRPRLQRRPRPAGST